MIDKKDPHLPEAWVEIYSAEWNKVTAKLLALQNHERRKGIMWEAEKKMVAGQPMYEVFRVVSANGITRRISGGLFLTRADADKMCERLNNAGVR